MQNPLPENKDPSFVPYSSFEAQLLKFLGTTASDKLRFKDAEQEINSYTKTKQCWASVLNILSSQTPPTGSSKKDQDQHKQLEFLASNILKDKFKYDFGQLGQDFAGVHTALLGVLQKFSMPEAPIRNNLSLCVVYTYMHKYAELGDLLEYLKNNLNKPELVPYVFTILMMLPEEIEDYKVVIEEEKRVELLKYMRQQLQRRILIQLNSAAAATWETDLVRKTTFLRCFANWIELKTDREVLASLPGHFILNAAIHMLGDSDISDECVNVITTVIKRLGEPQSSKELFMYLAQNMVSTCNVVKQMIESEAIEEFVEPFVKVICEFARCSIPQLLCAPTEESNNFLQNIVYISSERDAEYLEETTKFWISFCTTIVRERNQFAGGYYEGLLKTLFMSCCQVIQFTPAEALDSNTMTNKEIENKRANFELKIKLRQKLEELFDLIGQILGYTRTVEFLLETMAILDSQTKDYWCRLESLMFPLVKLIESIGELDGPYRVPDSLTEFVKRSIGLDPPFKCVERAILNFFAQCSELYQEDQLDLILQIFKYVNNKFQDPMLSQVASRTFEKICENNVPFVHQNLGSFMELFRLNHTNEKIMLGILNAIMRSQTLLQSNLATLCQPYIDTITSLDGKHSLSSLQKKDIKRSIDKLTLLISTLTKDGSASRCEPVIIDVFRNVWPSLRPEVMNPDESNHYESLERICKFIKNTMRCLRKQFWMFMEDVFSTILQAYQHYAVGSYVYAVEVAVTVFYKYPEHQQSLEIIFEKTCDTTFQHLQKLKNFQENPDLANDFFGMCVRFLRYNQQTILKCNKLPGILNLVTIACGVENPSIARPLYAFVERLYMLYWEPVFIDMYNNGAGADLELRVTNPLQTRHLVQALESQIVNSAGLLIQRMLSHLEMGPGSAVREYICDALNAEMKAFPKLNQSIWAGVLKRVGEDILTEVQKGKILLALGQVHEKESVEVLEEMVYRMSRRFLNSKMRAPVG